MELNQRWDTREDHHAFHVQGVACGAITRTAGYAQCSKRSIWFRKKIRNVDSSERHANQSR